MTLNADLEPKIHPQIQSPLPENEIVGFAGGSGQGQGFFICHIIVIQGITRSEMQSNQVRSVDSAKQ